MTGQAYIGIGSNLGDRQANCRAAVEGLGRLPGTVVPRVSPLYETAPQEGAAGGPFLNAVAAIATTLTPYGLLEGLQGLEESLGRSRPHAPGEARIIDLDLLLYDNVVIHQPDLVVPHPRMARRKFVLAPLAAIAPEVRHPVLELTAAELLNRLDSEILRPVSEVLR